ncbi:protein mono-ADP-ribosyltransferase PARP12-like [Anneissia japonica]|uniref:protein mono-ADP-ribosyltransferase PARP12-like n=1 Tax=Anneissia japonica TaxID=1529436 RepID=UPI001425BB30|nr:protein mono-ADP-ribosyltransferase PARP12-like [Anneissia japonica]
MASGGYKRRRSRGRRVGHQTCLTDETRVIERALRSLCQNDGKLSLEILEKKVGQFDPGLGSLEDIVSDFHDHFKIIDYADGSVFVKAHTQAKICPSYLKNDCEEGDACQNLHLCGYFATGSCCWFGMNKCRKSHHFRSDHNNQILKDLDIAFLSHECLKTLFRLAWPEFTVPDFCGLYRSPHGCQKHTCRFLHICKNYVMNECRYRTRCKFSHDICASDSNERLLQRFNINVNDYSSYDIIRLIKERHEGIYRPDVEVLDSDGKDSDGEERDGDASCSSDIYDTMMCAFNEELESENLLTFTRPAEPSSGQSRKAYQKTWIDNLHDSYQQTRAVQDKKEEICQKYLQGSCTSDLLCPKHHCDLPYQWQIHIGEKWESVDSYKNNAMEKKYCDMTDNETACLVFDTWGRMQISFDGMFLSNYIITIPIRRLEVKCKPSDAHWISHWSWYWKDECGTWIEYAEQNTKQNARSDKESSDFETSYDAYKNRSGSQTVKFKAGNQHYTLNFGTMVQTNDEYRTQKDVRRRPSKHITSADVKRYREEKPWCRSNNNKYPRTWNRAKSHLLVEVSKHSNSEEYRKIQKMFQATLPGVNITKIERVQNETWWDSFSRQKEVMMKKNPNKPVDERLLFHGTKPEIVQDICRDNFDFRLSGTRVGAIYGQGAYFASTSKYSDSYAEADRYSIKKMFVARVLVGSYTTGTRDMRRPPYKNPSDKTKGMYDSCVDNASNPSIFVLFDNHQVYPEYVITYTSPSVNQYIGLSTNYTSYGSSRQTSSYTSSQAARSTSNPPSYNNTYTSNSNNSSCICM